MGRWQAAKLGHRLGSVPGSFHAWPNRAGLCALGKGLTEAACWPARGQCEKLNRLELAATPLLLMAHDCSSLSDPCMEVGVWCVEEKALPEFIAREQRMEMVLWEVFACTKCSGASLYI